MGLSFGAELLFVIGRGTKLAVSARYSREVASEGSRPALVDQEWIALPATKARIRITTFRYEFAMNWGSDCLLHGRDVRTGDAVMVLIDHHPFWEFWGAWSAAGKPDILTYDEDIGIITWHEYAHA